MSGFSRRGFLGRTLAAAAVPVLTSRTAAGVCASPMLLPQLEEQEFAVPGLHPFHDGLKIVQLSDIHLGVTTPVEAVAQAIAIANAAKPDLVVLTGDYVNFSRSGIRLIREQLGGINGQVLAILGNHDHWVDANGVADALRHHRYEVLSNEHTRPVLRGAPLNVVAIDDLKTHHDDVTQAMWRVPKEPTLVLAHVPRTADQLRDADRPIVQLSGHTHGGQIHFGGLTDAIVRLIDGDPYQRGRFGVGCVQLHVNRGLGNSGPPIRVDSAPEVTAVTLRRAEPA